MKTSASSFDRLVESHYQAIYEVAAKWTADPARAASLTHRAFRHARNLLAARDRSGTTRETLVKILFLEFAAGRRWRAANVWHHRQPLFANSA